jgi:hypothetical protein
MLVEKKPGNSPNLSRNRHYAGRTFHHAMKQFHALACLISGLYDCGRDAVWMR